MRTVRTIATVAIVLILILFSGIRSRHVESNHTYPRYDVATEARVGGVIRSVDEFQCPVSGGALGTHILLQSNERVVRVHLGPSAFISARNLRVVKGERIEVMGSTFSYAGNDDVIAREVVRKEGVYMARDANGNPLWSK